MLWAERRNALGAGDRDGRLGVGATEGAFERLTLAGKDALLALTPKEVREFCGGAHFAPARCSRLCLLLCAGRCERGAAARDVWEDRFFEVLGCEPAVEEGARAEALLLRVQVVGRDHAPERFAVLVVKLEALVFAVKFEFRSERSLCSVKLFLQDYRAAQRAAQTALLLGSSLLTGCLA